MLRLVALCEEHATTPSHTLHLPISGEAVPIGRAMLGPDATHVSRKQATLSVCEGEVVIESTGRNPCKVRLGARDWALLECGARTAISNGDMLALDPVLRTRSTFVVLVGGLAPAAPALATPALATPAPPIVPPPAALAPALVNRAPLDRQHAAASTASAVPCPSEPVQPSASLLSQLRACAKEIAARGRFSLCLIVGPTASGKSTLLRQLAHASVLRSSRTQQSQWPADRAIVSHIAHENGHGVPAAINRLSAVGLSAVPSWVKPFTALSNGMQERAALALSLSSQSCVDDFGATVDEQARRLLSVGVG